MRNGRVSWVGVASADDPLSNFMHMTGGTMSKWRTAHFPLTATVQTFGGWSDGLTGLSGNSLLLWNWLKHMGFGIGANNHIPSNDNLTIMYLRFKGNTSPVALVDPCWLELAHDANHFIRRKVTCSLGPSPSRSLQGLNKVLHLWSKVRAYIITNSDHYNILTNINPLSSIICLVISLRHHKQAWEETCRHTQNNLMMAYWRS